MKLYGIKFLIIMLSEIKIRERSEYLLRYKGRDDLTLLFNVS